LFAFNALPAPAFFSPNLTNLGVFSFPNRSAAHRLLPALGASQSEQILTEKLINLIVFARLWKHLGFIFAKICISKEQNIK
jgi:hypothetical protein